MDFATVAQDIWSNLEDCRHNTADNPLLKWVLLEEWGSMEGNIGGLRVFNRGLIRNKEYAEIIISNDVGVTEDFENKGFSIHSWRRNHLPVKIFTTAESVDYEKNLQAVTEKMEEIALKIGDAAREGNLEQIFPNEWIGESVGSFLREKIINPNEERFKIILYFLMIVPPVVLAVSMLLPQIYFFPLALTFFLGGGIAAILLGFADEHLEAHKYSATFFSAVFIMLSWTIVIWLS